jgi:hypothetical protein
VADKALLIGLDHYRQISGLRGCRNDVTSWNRLLVDVAGFAPTGIRTLTDADAVKANVLSHLVWLAEGAKVGDRLVLMFSGHGSFTVDTSGDEPDGYDELVCLYGYPDEYLLDDEIRDWVATVDQDVDLTLIFDSCHAGTMTREIPGVPSDPLAPRRGPLVVIGPGDTGHGAVDPCLLDPTSPACRLARFAPPPAEIEAHPLAPPPPGAVDQEPRDPRRRLIERAASAAPERAIALTACQANQTSADAFLGGDYHGAFSYYTTARLTQAGKVGLGRSVLIRDVTRSLKSAGFTQVPAYEAARPRVRVLGQARAAR